MPHIQAKVTELGRNIEIFNAHVFIRFSKDYYRTKKAEQKLEEIRQRIEAVVNEYFPDVAVDAFMNNHEYNLHKVLSHDLD